MELFVVGVVAFSIGFIVCRLYDTPRRYRAKIVDMAPVRRDERAKIVDARDPLDIDLGDDSKNQRG